VKVHLNIRKRIKTGGLVTAVLVVMVLLSGCVAQNQATSPISQQTATASSSVESMLDLLIKQSDAPGLTLKNYAFFAASESAVLTVPDEFIMEQYQSTMEQYTGVIPAGKRNVGQTSTWGDNASRIVKVTDYKFDSNTGITEYFSGYLKRCDSYGGTQETETTVYRCGSSNVGDISYYTYETPKKNSGVQITYLQFSKGNHIVFAAVADENSKSYDETVRIAKLVEGRLT